MRFISYVVLMFTGMMFIVWPHASIAAQPPTVIYGAIFTTGYNNELGTCEGVDLNIYDDAMDVYINGGPARPGAAGLPPGEYHVKVTEPNGRVLGSSTLGGGMFTVGADGEFGCYRLWDIVYKSSDRSLGFDPTSNPGGEYKVWISKDETFPNRASKTDNFKIGADEVDSDGDGISDSEDPDRADPCIPDANSVGCIG